MKAAPFITLFVIWAVWFWRFFTPSPGDRLTYPPGDFTLQFVTFRDVMYRSLVAGRFPLWTDCLWSGYPIHADPQAQTFYPPIYITFGLLRVIGWGHFPIEALVAEIALHYFAMSVFVFVFLRSHSLGRPASIFGALVFTYGGYLLGYPPLQTVILATDAWLPLCLLFARRLATHRHWRDLAWMSVMLALAFLAGHPQTFTYVALVTFAYLSFQIASQSGPLTASIRPILKYISVGVVLVIALTAVQLVPSLHFILNSTRANVPLEQAGHGLPFEDVLQFLITGFVSYWHPLYVGILSLGLALFALGQRRREQHFWATAALIGLVLSFGAKAGVYDLAYWLVPGWRLFRGQERVVLITVFSLSVLAAFGAQAALDPLRRPMRRALAHLQHASALLLFVAIIVLSMVTYLDSLGHDPSNWQELPNRAGVFVLASGLACMALTVRTYSPRIRRWLPMIFLFVAFVDTFAANHPLNVVPAFDAFPPNPLIEPIQSDRSFFRVQDDSQLPAHAGCAYGYRAIEGGTPYAIATYARFLERAPELARWQWLGVRYVASWRDSFQTLDGQLLSRNVLASGIIPDEKGNVTKTFLLDFVEPRRAWLASDVTVVLDDEVWYAQLANPELDPFKQVFLPEPISASGGGSVAIITDYPGTILLRVTADAPTVLVISEAYFPGWTAIVDGQPTRVRRANGALMALAVPRGEHRVELSYRPAMLIWGGAISLIGVLATLAFLIGWRRR